MRQRMTEEEQAAGGEMDAEGVDVVRQELLFREIIGQYYQLRTKLGNIYQTPYREALLKEFPSAEALMERQVHESVREHIPTRVINKEINQLIEYIGGLLENGLESDQDLVARVDHNLHELQQTKTINQLQRDKDGLLKTMEAARNAIEHFRQKYDELFDLDAALVDPVRHKIDKYTAQANDINTKNIKGNNGEARAIMDDLQAKAKNLHQACLEVLKKGPAASAEVREVMEQGLRKDVFARSKMLLQADLDACREMIDLAKAKYSRTHVSEDVDALVENLRVIVGERQKKADDVSFSNIITIQKESIAYKSFFSDILHHGGDYASERIPDLGNMRFRKKLLTKFGDIFKIRG